MFPICDSIMLSLCLHSVFYFCTTIQNIFKYLFLDNQAKANSDHMSLPVSYEIEPFKKYPVTYILRVISSACSISYRCGYGSIRRYRYYSLTDGHRLHGKGEWDKAGKQNIILAFQHVDRTCTCM